MPVCIVSLRVKVKKKTTQYYLLVNELEFWLCAFVCLWCGYLAAQNINGFIVWGFDFKQRKQQDHQTVHIPNTLELFRIHREKTIDVSATDIFVSDNIVVFVWKNIFQRNWRSIWQFQCICSILEILLTELHKYVLFFSFLYDISSHFFLCVSEISSVWGEQQRQQQNRRK